MDNLSRSGRGNAPKHYDSDSSSQNEDPGPESAPLRQSSDGTKGSSSSSGKQQKQEHKAPWMNARPLPPQPNTTSLDWVPPNPFAQDAPEDPTAPKEKIQTTLDNIPLVTTSTVTTTITAPVAPPSSNLMTVVSRSKANNAKGKLAEASVASPKVPGLNLTKSLTTVTAPDPTETPKSSRSARGEKNSSDLLTLKASQLRAMGQGRTDMRLPEFSHKSQLSLAKSESLAAQIVIADSKWFQSTLNTGMRDTMLRGGVMMKHPVSEDDDLDAENVIEKFQKPFIEHYLAKSGLRKILENLKSEYDTNYADKAEKIYLERLRKQEIGAAYEPKLLDDPDMKQLLDPLIKPLLDFILGADRTLRTSGYPAPILNLMVHMSAWAEKWQEANSLLTKEQFEQARSNALKALAANRSFMVDFFLTIKLKKSGESMEKNDLKDANDGAGDKYRSLYNYLNLAVTRAMQDLVNNIVHATAAERELIQRFADIAETKALRSGSDAEKRLDETAEKAKAHKPKPLTRLQDAITGLGKKKVDAKPRARLRRAGTFNAKAPASRGEEKVSAKAEKPTVATVFTEDDVRKLQNIRKRQKKLHKYFDELKRDVFGGKIDSASFPEWVDITKTFLKKISHGSREDNQAFSDEPNQVFWDFLNDFIKNRVFHNHSLSDGLRELQDHIELRINTEASGSVDGKEKS